MNDTTDQMMLGMESQGPTQQDVPVLEPPQTGQGNTRGVNSEDLGIKVRVAFSTRAHFTEGSQLLKLFENDARYRCDDPMETILVQAAQDALRHERKYKDYCGGPGEDFCRIDLSLWLGSNENHFLSWGQIMKPGWQQFTDVTHLQHESLHPKLSCIGNPKTCWTCNRAKEIKILRQATERIRELVNGHEDRPDIRNEIKHIIDGISPPRAVQHESQGGTSGLQPPEPPTQGWSQPLQPPHELDTQGPPSDFIHPEPFQINPELHMQREGQHGFSSHEGTIQPATVESPSAVLVDLPMLEDPQFPQYHQQPQPSGSHPPEPDTGDADEYIDYTDPAFGEEDENIT